LYPHIPPGIKRLEQRFPIRFGSKRLFLAVTGSGPITSVRINGNPWKTFSPASVDLPFEPLPSVAAIEVVLGNEKPRGFQAIAADYSTPALPPLDNAWDRMQKTNLTAKTVSLDIPSLLTRADPLRRFHEQLCAHGFADTYEAAHARLALSVLSTAHQRLRLLAQERLTMLPNVASQNAADQLYLDTVAKLIQGLSQQMDAARNSADPKKRQMASWFNLPK